MSRLNINKMLLIKQRAHAQYESLECVPAGKERAKQRGKNQPYKNVYRVDCPNDNLKRYKNKTLKTNGSLP